MAEVHMTAAQFRKLGVDPKLGSTRTVKRPSKQRREARGNYHTTCKSCGEDFTTRASEDEHLNRTRHANYLLVLD